MILIEEEELEGTYEFITRRDFNKISDTAIFLMLDYNIVEWEMSELLGVL